MSGGAAVKKPPAFSKRTTVILSVVATLSFVIAVLVGIFGDELNVVPTAGADGYSRSALGHKAFVALLKKMDVPVIVSRHASADRASDRGVLVIAEPQLGEEGSAKEIEVMVNTATRVLLVLPKRRGEADDERPAYVKRTGFVGASDVTEVLSAAGTGGHVERVEAPPLGGELGTPAIDGPVQLVVDSQLEPIIGGDKGVLLGKMWWGRHELWVLADPDVIANHGLGDGDNALIALRAIERLRGDDGGAVVIDETLHGHVSPPSLWRELAEFPLVCATLSALLVLAVLLWAAMRRFGAPRPAGPGIAPGKSYLIENTAELMRLSGHAAHALERYFAATVQDVAAALHAPAQLSQADTRVWLARLAKGKKVGVDLDALEKEVKLVGSLGNDRAAHALAVAGRIHRFRKEMIDGPSDHPRHR